MVIDGFIRRDEWTPRPNLTKDSFVLDEITGEIVRQSEIPDRDYKLTNTGIRVLESIDEMIYKLDSLSGKIRRVSRKDAQMHDLVVASHRYHLNPRTGNIEQYETREGEIHLCPLSVRR